VQSFEPGEAWRWCYVHELFAEPDDIAPSSYAELR
jgi:hypothetical protein